MALTAPPDKSASWGLLTRVKNYNLAGLGAKGRQRGVVQGRNGASTRFDVRRTTLQLLPPLSTQKWKSLLSSRKFQFSDLLFNRECDRHRKIVYLLFLNELTYYIYLLIQRYNKITNLQRAACLNLHHQVVSTGHISLQAKQCLFNLNRLARYR